MCAPTNSNGEPFVKVFFLLDFIVKLGVNTKEVIGNLILVNVTMIIMRFFVLDS